MPEPAGRTPTQVRADMLRRHRTENRHAATIYRTAAGALRGETDLVTSGILTVVLIVIGLTAIFFAGGIYTRNDAIVISSVVAVVAILALTRLRTTMNGLQQENEAAYDRTIEDNLALLDDLDDFDSDTEVPYGS